MAPPSPLWRTAVELAQAVREGSLRAEDVVRAHLQHIHRVEGTLRAFLRLTEEEALAAAREIDRAVAAGRDPGPLAGIPVALKDNLCTRGIETTAASRALAGFVPPYDATVVERLREAGAVILGKTNMDEFAMGSSTENSAFFPTANPWDADRVPGGSSGGSAAAVAGGQVPIALGSDTGGSIRAPASFCGIVGLKPTYGRVSRYGLIAFASSLDQIGPMARTVRDAALVLRVIAGSDPRDSTSSAREVPDLDSVWTGEVRGLRVGIPREYMEDGTDPGVERAVREAVDRFRDAGAQVEEMSLPHSRYALPTYYLIAPAEASSNLARYDGVRYGHRTDRPAASSAEWIMRTRGEAFGPEVKRRIMLGTYALSAGSYDEYYGKALRVRRLVKEDFDRAFARYDLLMSPTVPTVAFRIREKIDDPMSMYLTDRCTVAANLAGVPAITVPCGFSEGLPVGLQIIGRPFEEVTLLRAADAFQQWTDYHRRRPPLAEAGAEVRVGGGTREPSTAS